MLLGLMTGSATSAKVLCSAQTSQGLQEVPSTISNTNVHVCWHKVTLYRMRVNILVLNVARIGGQRSRIILIKTRLKKQLLEHCLMLQKAKCVIIQSSHIPTNL